MHTDIAGGAEPVHHLDGSHERPSLPWQPILAAGEASVSEEIGSALETAGENALASWMRLGQRPVEGDQDERHCKAQSPLAATVLVHKAEVFLQDAEPL